MSDDLLEALENLAEDDATPQHHNTPAFSQEQPQQVPPRRPMPQPQIFAQVSAPQPKVNPTQASETAPTDPSQLPHQPAGETSDQFASTELSSLPGRATKASNKHKKGNLKATAAPILIAVGVMLLVPAIWAVMILSGNESAWRADSESAHGMAKLMLLAWPLALLLLGSGVACIVLYMKEKRIASQPNTKSNAKRSPKKTRRPDNATTRRRR